MSDSVAVDQLSFGEVGFYGQLLLFGVDKPVLVAPKRSGLGSNADHPLERGVERGEELLRDREQC